MGYTHYWKSLKFTPKNWAELQVKTHEVIKNLPSHVKLAFECDQEEKPVEISDVMIRFNGIGEKGHETFLLDFASRDFEFCKTARKPYDLAVCSVLILASLLSESGEISSDGIGSRYTDSEWIDAWKFLSNLFPSDLQDREAVFKAFSTTPDLPEN